MILALLAIARQAEPTLLDHAFEQWKSTPEMKIEDAYKWLYHATLGGEHAVTSEDGPRVWLDREWPTLSAPLKDEPEVVPLTPDGRLLRVNLRPYRSRGGDKDMLLWAFVFSAQRLKRDESLFVREWDALGAKLKSDAWRQLSHQEWKRLDALTRKQGFPAIEHSPQYEKIYMPAYRVVLKDMWTH